MAYTIRFRIRSQLLLAFLLPFLLIIFAIGLFTYLLTRNSLEEELGQRLVLAAQSVVTLGRLYTAVQLRPGDENTRLYRNLQKKLVSMQKNTGIQRFIIFDRQQKVLVDGAGKMPIGFKYLKLEFDRHELKKVFNGHLAASILFNGEDGKKYKTGYAPIKDRQGKIIGAIGADGSARFFITLEKFAGSFFFWGALGMMAVMLITMIISAALVKPINKLVKSVQAIGHGNFQQTLKVNSSNEIGFLAQRFEEMRSNILERDQRMQMMLSGIAHEVRNPLGGMELFGGMLAEEIKADGEDKLKYLARITREMDYLKKVVNQFLDFARHLQLETSKVECDQLLEEVIFLMAADADLKGIELKYGNRIKGLTLNCDREKIRSTLINLIHNAIWASRPGEKVEISCGATEKTTYFSVKDWGRGIESEDLEKIFTPFYTTRQQGTGLGLSLAKKIMDAHGGHIEVNSQLNEWTELKLILPIKRSF